MRKLNTYTLASFCIFILCQFSSVAQSCPTFWPHEPQHARPPCPLPTPGVHPNPCTLSRWCHPTISSSVIPFSYSPQSFPASGSFQKSQLFASGGQSIGVSASASVLPMNSRDWSPLGWTGWISLQSKGLSRVFSNTTVQKDPFFGSYCVDCNKLWKILKEVGIPDLITCLLRNLHAGQEATGRTRHGKTD